MNRFAASLTALLITVSSQGLAEPSDDIQTLMDEKLSMLDWGMYRIEQKLNQIEALTLFQKVKIYTTYDQSRDKIIIGLLTGSQFQLMLTKLSIRVKRISPRSTKS